MSDKNKRAAIENAAPSYSVQAPLCCSAACLKVALISDANRAWCAM
jgi:hypothetical protein